MVLEGIPGGPMDCWKDVTSPAEHLARSKWILDTFLPWEAERCRNVELTDANGILAGAFAPTVRKPVGRLPSGKAVLGLADAVVPQRSDHRPGLQQRLESGAASTMDAIVAHGDRPFDAAFMQATFDRYWDYAQYRDRLDQRPAAAAAAARAQHHGLGAGLSRCWPIASPTASTTRATCSRGSPCRKRPTGTCSNWRPEACYLPLGTAEMTVAMALAGPQSARGGLNVENREAQG